MGSHIMTLLQGASWYVTPFEVIFNFFPFQVLSKYVTLYLPPFAPHLLLAPSPELQTWPHPFMIFLTIRPSGGGWLEKWWTPIMVPPRLPPPGKVAHPLLLVPWREWQLCPPSMLAPTEKCKHCLGYLPEGGGGTFVILKSEIKFSKDFFRKVWISQTLAKMNNQSSGGGIVPPIPQPGCSTSPAQSPGCSSPIPRRDCTFFCSTSYKAW